MDFIKERYDLALERVTEIENECGTDDGIPENTAVAFKSIAGLWRKVCSCLGAADAKKRETVKDLLSGVEPANYCRSFTDPAFAVKKLKRKIGRLLSVMAAEPYALLKAAEEGKLTILTLYLEHFIEIYCIFRDAYEECPTLPEAEKTVWERSKQSFGYFMKDNLDIFMEDSTMKDSRRLAADAALQFVYDHRNDGALFLDKAYAARHAECFGLLENKDEKAVLGYDSVDFTGVTAVEKRERLNFTPAQEKIIQRYRQAEIELLSEHTGK